MMAEIDADEELRLHTEIAHLKAKLDRIRSAVKGLDGLVHESSEQSRVFINIINAVGDK